MFFWWFLRLGVLCKSWLKSTWKVLGAYSGSNIGSSSGMSDGGA